MVNYAKNLEKREIQKMTFPLIKKQKMVSLAGPNLSNYLDVIPSVIKDVEVYENSKKIMIVQMSDIKKVKRKITYHCKDIIHAEVDKRTFYDLDFCSSIKGAEDYIRKFGACAFSLTLSLRPVSLEKTLNRFFTLCDEKVLIDIPHPNYNLVRTTRSKYIYITYFDIWPMVTIFKFH
jgi:hypothetical protein